MSHYKPAVQQGFTLVELLISIVLIGILCVTFLVFFKSALFDYLNLQTDASSLTELATQEMRVGTVVRGLSDITSAGSNDLSIYSYFYPSDTYESQVHYYLQTNSGVKQLMADVTPMSANPPIGTPLTSQKMTYTVIANFYQPSGGTLFTYLDAGNSALPMPISDIQSIKAIQVNLASNLVNGSTQSVQVQVSLRNRKVNL